MSRGLKLAIGIPLIVLGALLVIGGGASVAFIGVDGRFSTGWRAHGDGVAVVVDSVDVRDLPRQKTLVDLQTEVELSARGAGEVFLGVAPAGDAEAYLAGAAIDRVDHVATFNGELQVIPVAGADAVAPPDEQDIWVVSSGGPGERRIRWQVEPGDWWVVVMNADGSAGVDVDGDATFRLPFLGPVAVAVLLFGLVILGGGVALLILGLRTPPKGMVAVPPPPGGAPARPDQLPG